MGVKIKGKYENNFSCSLVHDSGEEVYTDAPKDNNGNGQAFSPTDLVAAALASCMMTIIAIRANGKNISIGKPTFSVEKIMKTSPRMIQEIKIEISFSVPLTYNDQTYLESEARKCPVALSLNPEINQNVEFKYG
jgi:putative redox protein